MKKAFSMLEILIIIVIVGIIAVIMITTIKPRDLEAGFLYLNAYTFLKDAADNVLLDAEHAEPAQNFPSTPSTLCNAFAGYINTTETHCGASAPSFDTLSYSENWTPHLIASNNMKLYFSQTKSINGKTYMMIWVDLNGNRKPNSSKWTKGAPSDVVAFALSTDADLIIVGPPLFDTRYLWGRIHYTTDENGKGTYSKKLPFYQAQYRAFNGRQTPDDALSININSSIPSNSDLRAPANKMPTPTITDYDRSMCTLDNNTNYSSCTVQLLN